MKNIACIFISLLVNVNIWAQANQTLVYQTPYSTASLYSADNISALSSFQKSTTNNFDKTQIDTFILHNTLPECTDPASVECKDVSDNKCTVVWAGKPALAGNTEYIVKYKSVSKRATDNWIEIKVVEGNSIELINLEYNQTYQIEVQKVCYWKNETPIYSNWVGITVQLASERVTLPPFTCGTTFEYPTYLCQSNYLIQDTSTNFDVIHIGGFPIDVLTINYVLDLEGKVSWSGTGLVPLPFGENKYVKVEWYNARINHDSVICGTSGVLGIEDTSYDFDVPPLGIGGEICLPPPSSPGFDSSGIHSETGLEWDQYGFGPDGTYIKDPPYPGYQPGDPIDTTGQYDPNGFDVDGNHVLTDGPYNPEGCSREGFTVDLIPCNPNIDPYSWLNPLEDEHPTLAGTEFADEIKDTIEQMIIQQLNLLNDIYEFKRDSIYDACNMIRSDMRTLVTGLNFNANYIFGSDSIYFVEGMHTHFAAEPQTMSLAYDRNPNVYVLEQRHVDLYHCDKQQFVFQHLMDIISDFLGSGLNDLKHTILNRIKLLPESTINQFRANPAVFVQWLYNELKNITDEEYSLQYGSIGFIQDALPSQKGICLNGNNLGFKSKSFRYDNGGKLNASHGNGNMLAADLDNEFANLLMAQALDVRPEDLAFEYKQGFRLINGVHRAVYMDALIKQRNFALVSPNNENLMPIEITNRGTDGKKYSVFLDNIVFLPYKASCDVYIIIETPFDGQRLIFEAQAVEFTPHGPVVNPIKIQLANDVNVRINNNARLKLIAGPNTYVAFDCGGFAGLGVAADVELCRNIVLPYDPGADLIGAEPERVEGHFQAVMPSFSEFFITLTLDPFVIPQYEDIRWIIDSVSLDMSESISPTGAPPIGYNTPFANSNGFSPVWKGFYIDSLTVLLPRQFSMGSAQTSVSIQDLVVDNMGVSASVTANNILSLSNGNAGGWAFSIDSFNLTVIMNQFSNTSFNGLVNVPIFRAVSNTSGTLTADDCIDYRAAIDPGNIYNFTLSPFSTPYAVDMWKSAKVVINTGSSVQMKYENGQFKSTATLSGTVEIDSALLPNVNLFIPKISFQNVQVSNLAPYFSPGVWDFPNQLGANFAGFELGLQGVTIDTLNPLYPALQFKAMIGITDESIKITASGGLKILGELVTTNGRQRWKYKSFEVDRVSVGGSFPGVRYVGGHVDFYSSDPTYGTGFRGELAAEFEMMASSIQVVAQFGKMPAGYKYFFVDAMYCGNIPLAGALNIKGLGGGVYYKMSRANDVSSLPSCSGIPAISGQPGQSISGIVYTPIDSLGLGFKLTVAVGLLKSERAFNANATYEVTFHDEGGISEMRLYGNARFMSDLDISAPPFFNSDRSAPYNNGISANVNLTATFGGNSSLTGKVEVFANISGILVGTGDDGSVIDADVLFSNDDWHIKVGSPTTPAGMKLILPLVGELSQVSCYLQIGKELDPMPPLPQAISELLGGNSLDRKRQFPDDGLNGFIFGTHLQFGKNNIDFLKIFYAGLSLHLGLDVAVLDFGNANCVGETEPIGINGWYAQGQIYAGIEGEVGIRVKVFGQQKEIRIFTLSAAAAMEAKLPNPFWAKAAFGIDYKILNGFIEGHVNFEVELGEKCTVEGEETFSEFPIILSTHPANGQVHVPVNETLTVKFNFPIDSIFELTDLNDQTTSYEITLDSAKVIWRGSEIPNKKRLAEGKRKLEMELDVYLPERDTFTLIVQVHVDSNGINVATEKRTVTFTSGNGLDYLPIAEVEGSYPFDGQYNYYKDQITSPKGYIQLKRGRPGLFIETEESFPIVRFRQPGGNCAFVPVVLTAENYWDRRIEFDIPSGFLENEEVYEMQVLNFPKSDPNWGAGFSGAAPCICTNCTMRPSQAGGGASTTNQKIPPAAGDSPPALQPNPIPVETVLFTAYFRVSQFNTFVEKVEALESAFMSIGNRIQDDEIEPIITKTIDIEPFDKYELNGGIKLSAPISNTPTNNDTTNWFYTMKENFAVLNTVLPDMPTNVGSGFSAPPQFTKAVNFISNGNMPIVKKENYSSNSFPASYVTNFQHLKFFAPSIILEYHDALTLQADSYELDNFASILAAYGNSCDGVSVPICFELKCDNYSNVPYTRFFRNLIFNCNNVSPGIPAYFTKFEYYMPGWPEVQPITKTIRIK